MYQIVLIFPDLSICFYFPGYLLTQWQQKLRQAFSKAIHFTVDISFTFIMSQLEASLIRKDIKCFSM